MKPIRKAVGPVLWLLPLLVSGVARAGEEAPAVPASAPAAERVTDEDEPAAELPTRPEVAPEVAPAAEVTPVPATPESTPPAAASPEVPVRDPFLRRAMLETAVQERRQRFAEGLLGLTGAGVLFGTGFAAEGPDMTASHWLWVASGLAAAGSLASFFIPSPFEHLAGEAAGKSDAELRAKWKKLAEQARVERRAGAVLGTLVGGAAIALGVLTLEDQVWNLSNDARLIVGTGLIGGGAFGVTKGAIDWFMPTSVERGYAFVAEPPKLALSLTGAPQGFGLGVKGVFQ